MTGIRVFDMNKKHKPYKHRRSGVIEFKARVEQD